MEKVATPLTGAELVKRLNANLTVANRAELLALTGLTDNDNVRQLDIDLLYKYSAIQGTDNGGTVLNIGTGSLVAKYSGTEKLEWFGDVNLEQTFKKAHDASLHGVVLVNAGTYTLDANTIDFTGLTFSTNGTVTINTNTTLVVGVVGDAVVYSGNALGTLIKGWLDSSLGDATTDTVNVHAQPGTVVEYFNGTKLVELTLSTTVVTFTNSIQGGLNGLMYCDYAGNIGFTVSADNHAMPLGDYVILAKETQYYSGISGTTFSYEPLNRTNHFLQNYSGLRVPKPLNVTEINADDFGVIDVAVNSKDLFYRLEILCASINITTSSNVKVFFKDGTYTIDQVAGTQYQHMRIRGQSTESTIFKSEVPGVIKVISASNIKNITLIDIAVTNYTDPEYFIMDKVKLTTTVDDGGLYYVRPLARHVKITNCELAYTNNIYIGIDVSGYESIYLNNNKLNLAKAGHAWHNIRVSSPYSLFRNHSVTISNNTMYNGVTGIIFALDRYSRPIIAPVIENNHLFYCEEESISFDGIGNNTAMPVIANGVITTKLNDVNDRLVITADLVNTDGTTANQIYTMTADDNLDWFFCTLDEGSGIDGTVVPIYSFDAVAGTITLDTTTNASKITTGGNIGIHSGAFGAVVRNNDITGEYRGGSNYKVNGISLWMNSFGAIIENNTITSCASGINVAGGLMLSTYKSRAYNNTARNNRFIECANDLVPYGIPVQFISHSTTADHVFMYGNKFYDNFVQSGVSNVLINSQKNFTYRNNTLIDIDVDWQYCATALPVPSSANVGEDFTEIIENVSGDPISIKNYTCAYDGANYIWVQITDKVTRIGKVVKGWLDSSLGDAVNNIVNIHAQPGTVVEYFNGTELVELTLSTTTFMYDRATYGDNLIGLMYCDFNGNLGFTTNADNHVMPEGDYITLAKSGGWYNGISGVTFDYTTFYPSNHVLTRNGGYYLANPDIKEMVYADDFGTIDVAVNSKDLFTRLIYAAGKINIRLKQNLKVFFKDGVYTIDQVENANFQDLRLHGQSRDGTIFKSEVAGVVKGINACNMENITLTDLTISNYTTPDEFLMDNVLLTTTVSNTSLYYVKTLSRNVKIVNSEWRYAGSLYVALDVTGYDSVLVENNKFNIDKTGHAWHNIRIASPNNVFRNHCVKIENNLMYNGVTGIFLACSRYSRPFLSVVINRNNIFYVEEESISIDGVGNNVTMPVIANGTITAKSNDADGRLVLTPTLVWNPDGASTDAAYTISADTNLDWFFCTLDEGSGKEGSVIPIHSYDPVLGTITLDTFTYAADVNIDGELGIHSGAFDCEITNNKVTGEYRGGANNKVHGVSLWLNAFGTLIENNTIIACSSGVNVAGGLMLSTYKSRAYNNVVQNNKFIECCSTVEYDRVPVSFISHSDTSKIVTMYGNKFINNTVQGGAANMVMNRQQNFTFRDNKLIGIDIDWTYCGVALPIPSSANVGQDAMEIIDDAVGTPISISTYTCVLNNGVYGWTQPGASVAVVADQPNVVIGELLTGLVYPTTGVDDAVNNDLDYVNLNIDANTTIMIRDGIDSRNAITLVAGVHQLNFGEHSDKPRYMYCDYSGDVFFTTILAPDIPTDQKYILLAHNDVANGQYTGAGGTSFYWESIFPNNHFLQKYGASYNPNLDELLIDATEFGVIGDGVVDNNDAFLVINTLATSIHAISGNLLEVYFPAGTYNISKTLNLNKVIVRGSDRDTTIIKNTLGTLIDLNVFNIHNITLEDIRIGDYNPCEKFVFKNSRMTTAISVGSTYYCWPGSLDMDIDGVDFNYLGDVYIGIYVYDFRHVSIKRCTFGLSKTGYASHVIRVENPNSKIHSVDIRDNTMYHGKTGIIFLGLANMFPTVGSLIENNNVFYMEEESISFDGLGNNSSTPIICNGTIASLSNDSGGRLVVTADMIHTLDSSTATPSLVSDRTDWDRYYFTFDENTGREGATIPIFGYDAVLGTFTLDTFLQAADVNIGGNVGIHSGIFNSVIRGNRVTGEHIGMASGLVHGISLWLNVFNTLVENNTIVSCSSGIQVSGGAMLTVLKSRSYNNHILNNRIIECCAVGGAGRQPVKITSEYSNTIKQYGNKFIGNTVLGGVEKLNISHQQHFEYRDNTLQNVAGTEWSYCGNTLPVPDSSNVGQDFTERVDDANGTPVSVNTYICTLNNGVYGWVNIANDKHEIGEIISGWIEPVLNHNDVDPLLDIVDVVVNANTRVRTSDGEVITLNVQAFAFDYATYGNSISNKMYCDRAGVLYFTTKAEPDVPEGDFILLAMPFNTYSGANGNMFTFEPVMPSNHILNNYGRYYINKPKLVASIVFDDFGGKTDATTDVGPQAIRMRYAADAISKLTSTPICYFPDGTYVFDGSTTNRLENLKVKGESEAGTIFSSNDTTTPTVRNQNIGYLENITLRDISTIAYYDAYLKNVTYQTAVNSGGLYLCQCRGENTYIDQVTQDFSVKVYVGIYVTNWSNAVVKESIFNPSLTGYATHNVKVEPPKTKVHKITINDNEVYGGLTGIFLGGSRAMPVVGAVIEKNVLKYQIEESISMDGYGNNTSSCPTICNGTILSVDNSGPDGRLAVIADMFYTSDGLTTIASPLSLRTDWTDFYYSFDDDSGKEGVILPIHSFDDTTNTIILETLALASELNIGGSVGVQSGFFNCVVRDNEVTGSYGVAPYSDNVGYYGRGISLYLNVFGTLVENNTITSCASGIILLGGFMLGVYRLRVYNNILRGNKIIDCNTFASENSALALKTIYITTTVKFSQFGNQVLDNIVRGGLKIEIHSQKDFIYRSGNDDTPLVEYLHCASQLPIPSSVNVGNSAMEIIDDANGVPIIMKEHVCGFDGTAYKWVSLADAAVLNAPQTFTKAQRGNKDVQVYAATVSLDMDKANDFEIILTGNLTLALPTNLVANQSGYIYLKQDAVGSRLLTLSTEFKTANGAGVVLSTTPNAVDVIGYTVRDTSTIDLFFSGDHK